MSISTDLQELSSKASTICRRIGKPSQAHAGIMRQLFPSSSSDPKRPRLSSAFDPTQQCVALQQKQKKAARCKPSKVTVVVVRDATMGVPRGKYRSELQKAKRIEKLEFMRNMSALQVRNTIIRGFQHLPLASFTFLPCDGENSRRLISESVQDQDGNMIVSAAQSRKGSLYVAECTHVSIYVYI